MKREFSMGDGIRLAADELAGWRPTSVVLLHGGGQTRHAWGDTARTLASGGWGTIAVDLRGHGDSDWSPRGDYSVERFATDVRTIIASLPRPPVLVGASLGGLSSLLALESPRTVRAAGVVLVDVAHRFEPSGGRRIIEFMRRHPDGFERPDEAAADIASYLPHRPRRANLAGLRKNLRLRDGRWRWHWDPALLANTRPLSDPASAREYAARLRAVVASLTIPVTLVRGSISDVVTREIAREFDQLSPHTRVVEVPGASHMVAGDSNEAFTRAVHEFLRRFDPEPSPVTPARAAIR